jgi:hypothetical protein
MTRPRDAQFWAYVEACLDNDMSYSEALNMAEWDLWDRVEPDFTEVHGDPLLKKRAA